MQLFGGTFDGARLTRGLFQGFEVKLQMVCITALAGHPRYFGHQPRLSWIASCPLAKLPSLFRGLLGAFRYFWLLPFGVVMGGRGKGGWCYGRRLT